MMFSIQSPTQHQHPTSCCHFEDWFVVRDMAAPVKPSLPSTTNMKSTTVTSPLIVNAVAAKTVVSPASVLQMLQGLILLSAIPIAMALGSKAVRNSPYLFRIIWVAAYLSNLVTVSIPGRFDGQVSSSSGKVEFPWKTVFAPAGWAFAIWGDRKSTRLNSSHRR